MKVLIADDHWISRAGLSHLLSIMEPACEVAEATTFDESTALLTAQPFDLCLVDPAMSKQDPLGSLKGLRGAAPAVALVVITMQASRRTALQAIECGAQGFIAKSASAEEIRRTIERVLAGEIALPANFSNLPAGQMQGVTDPTNGFTAETGNPLTVLTQRQRAVLELIATGKRNAEIGEILNISPRTVQIHVSTILKLLGVGNRTEAALLARRHGIGNE